ncbi:MAG: DUF429 domain-containing protein [Actinomycetes bacterium]
MTAPTCVGIDLAWGTKARTGIAVLADDGRLAASTSVVSDAEISAFLDEQASGRVVAAIDAPLIVVNETGRRACEAELGRDFQAYHAGAHTSNLAKPWFNPQPRGALLAASLNWSLNPAVRPNAATSVAIEVYPHPAMVSLFELDRVIPYKNKRGRDLAALKAAFDELMNHMERVLDATLDLRGSRRWSLLRATAADASRKVDLGRIEDEVDAIFCAYLAWLWANDRQALRVYGDYASGYIVTPPPPDVPARRTVAERDSRGDQTGALDALAALFLAAKPDLTGHEARALASIARSHLGVVDVQS